MHVEWMYEMRAEMSPAEKLTLALMYSTAWREAPEDIKSGLTPHTRSWKGYAFWVLKRLQEKGYIDDSAGCKTVWITGEGEACAAELLGSMGYDMPRPTTRTLPREEV